MRRIRARLRHREVAIPIDHAGHADDPDAPRPPDAIPSTLNPADRAAIHRAYRVHADGIYAAHERTDSHVDDAAGTRRPSSGVDVVVNPDGTVRSAWPREGDRGVIKNPKES